ncbi:Glycine cleavage system transcriptional activator (plasmid) [Labrenzia sp. THAF191b]|uniref:LysR family transcriptional regulator n=1 Tax=unclassified Labrenzia TaxID=2648686 RepID=UPI001269828A|nr:MULTISPECIES: LysR family transcriptional regulator [unclassified Labrenzia]QFT01676.1 Glycine cleavage system transcriptional activator [Labrenzia sp. THAF191b]QFT07881.1 Glycine cleavage system transcriptional activator [Labrenzia sp. THAF191a]QFT19253.1 Glycine cleavage system transcriptional activator [Labrenzia sp. THAF187b]
MKRDRLPPLEWIRAFEAAARLGSFTAAAGDVGLTQAAVSQRIGQLEKQLGIPLFHRQARAISLTVEGEAWLPHVRLALEGLRDSTEAVFGTGHRRLTLSASQTIIDLWLLPRLGRLQTLTKAEISIQSMVIGTHDAPQDDVIRIRYGTGDWPHTYRARLYAEEISPVAAPSLMASTGHWTTWPRISCAGQRPGWHDWATEFAILTTPLPDLRFDTHLSALGAAKAGLGVFLASLPLCAEALSSGALVRLDPGALSHHRSYWLLASPQAVTRDQWKAITTAIINSD